MADIDPTDLRAAADILDRHPCEVYMLNEHCRRAADEIERLRAELEWYGEQARLARLIHSEGDEGRHALAADGGKRARDALNIHHRGET